MEGDKILMDINNDSFICYNWMPTVADHCLDHSEHFYQWAGVSRLHNHDDINPKNIKENDVVFVKTDEIYNGNFQKNILPRIKNKFTLISGISSYNIGSNGDLSYLDIVNNSRVKYWFCTNPPDVDTDKIIPLPIGFEERERDGGNQEVLKKHWDDKMCWGDKSDLYYLPYHTTITNPLRNQHIKHLASLDFVHVEKDKLPFDQYLEHMGRYKFIICLEGSGYDTHRNYESLLVGSVPIMIDSPVRKIYDRYSLPSVFLEKWTDIGEYRNLELLSYQFDSVDNFLKIGLHTERILRYAKN